MKDTARIAYKRVIQKRQHTWASAGFEHKSDYVYYTVPGNKNGKMSHRVYIDSILEPVVKPWILDMRAGRILAIQAMGAVKLITRYGDGSTKWA